MSMESPLNVATPLTALTVVVPDSVPLDGLLAIATVTAALLEVTTLLLESSTLTLTAGVIALPAAASLG